MEYGAIELHKKERQIRIVTQEGAVIDRRIATTRAAFQTMFWGRAPMRVLLEASTESEWVAQCLEGLGHEVIVADPNYAPMYGQRHRRVKTDKRDVAALCAACRTGTYRSASRVSAAQRARRQELRVRRHLIQMRTRSISLLRALVRQEGLRLPRGSRDAIVARLDQVALPPALGRVLTPVRAVLVALHTTLEAIEDRIETLANHDDTAQRLMTAPGV